MEKLGFLGENGSWYGLDTKTGKLSYESWSGGLIAPLETNWYCEVLDIGFVEGYVYAHGTVFLLSGLFYNCLYFPAEKSICFSSDIDIVKLSTKDGKVLESNVRQYQSVGSFVALIRAVT